VTKKKKLIIALVLVIGGGLAVLQLLQNMLLLGWAAYSMTQPTVTPDPVQMRTQNALIRLEDLPAGIGKERPVSQLADSDPRALREVGKIFYGQEEWMMVTHTIVVYPTSEMAQMAYQLEMPQGTAWQVMTSPPTLEADYLHIVCTAGYTNEHHKYTCVTLGVYGEILSVLRTRIDDIWMTEREFTSLVLTMDYRVSSSLESSE